MKGIVIDEGCEYFTFLKEYFFYIDNAQKNYNWLITGQECYPQNAEYGKLLANEYCWISGEKLTEMVENEDFQWIWGVLSAFDKKISEAEVMNYDLPQANGYTGFWKNPVSIQHPLAEMEIVAWDSSLTIFISKNDSIIEKVKKWKVLVKDLEEYNR